MAQNTNVTVGSTDWTQLTNANASAIRVQNLSAAQDVILQATSGAGQGSNPIPRMTAKSGYSQA